MSQDALSGIGSGGRGERDQRNGVLRAWLQWPRGGEGDRKAAKGNRKQSGRGGYAAYGVGGSKCTAAAYVDAGGR